MQVTKIEKARNKYRVYLNDEPCFILTAAEYASCHINENEELSEERYRMICGDILLKRAKLRCLKLLEIRDRTEDELKRKLSQDLFPEEVIGDALEYVRSYHYIDDEAYAQRYVQANKDRCGRKMLTYELIRRGIAPDIAAAAVDDEGTDEAEAIRKWNRKRNFDPAQADEKERARQIRFLVGKGFSLHHILKEME